jgi:ubiquinone/menaquinone biosynthesis C-methylase UbiE
MAHSVCPWWLGYFLASPVRRLWQHPVAILRPFVHEGMTVLEPGCGMGFFTIELARLVGPGGKVIAVDLQDKMLAGLTRRATRAGVSQRIDVRQVQADTLGVADLDGRVDFILAFAMLHELPEGHRFFEEAYRALKPGGKLLAVEPSGHVDGPAFATMVTKAERTGFRATPGPAIRSSHTIVLERN